MKQVSVLVVDDHVVVRRGMAALLEGKKDLAIVGEAADGETAVRLARELQPEVILMDLKMPVLDGVSAIRQIRKSKLPCKILVITSFSDDELVISALQAGADGYLLKSNMSVNLHEAILQMVSGTAPLDPLITTTVLRKLSGAAGSKQQAHDELTERELSVLQLLATGLSDQQIAEKLQISPRTASTHVSKILHKLGVDNRTQAALYALRRGMVPREQ